MISGSSIANTVTTGALTIPAMKRVGYRPHFAAAVEVTSNTGGQITPPIMGAAAFIMIEFQEMPYRTILLAATVPALMHYLGIFTMVHLEAKLAEMIVPLVPFGLTDLSGVTLFLTLIFTAIACILLGAGIPTTAT